MTRLEKFNYIVTHWFLKDNVVYSRRTGKPLSFPCTDRSKHSSQNIHFDGGSQSIYIHEAVYMLHHNRPIGEGNEIHHIDHNPLNNSPLNLVEVTPLQHRRIHAYECDDPLRAIRLNHGSWQFRWWDDSGHRHCKHFHEINDAMMFRAEIEEPNRAELRALGLLPDEKLAMQPLAA